MKASKHQCFATARRLLMVALLLLGGWNANAADRLTLGMRNASLSDVMSMLARQNRVNILLTDGVEADVSFNLYDVTLDEAIRSIAHAAGYMVERRQNTYFIVTENQAGKVAGGGFTIVKSMPVRYADPAQLESKLADYLSDFGNITALPERQLLVVEDQPGFVWRISQLMKELDQRPPQVLIEAKILEIKLNDEFSFGVNWNANFSTDEGEGDFGIQGLLSPGNSGNQGFFFNYLEPRIQAQLRALEADGRVRNLASPKVVTLVNEEAEVIIGDRRGYRVTTTINQVTTESIEFLESGTILRVTPTIDDNGQIMLDIHPEVSTGTVDENGIPSQTTTEVTTQLLVPDGESIFIGGLMRNTTTEGRTGVPVLGQIPGVRWLFSSKSRTTVNTETVVVITPRLVDNAVIAMSDRARREIGLEEQDMTDHATAVDETMDDSFRERAPDQSKPPTTEIDEPMEIAPESAEPAATVTRAAPAAVPEQADAAPAVTSPPSNAKPEPATTDVATTDAIVNSKPEPVDPAPAPTDASVDNVVEPDNAPAPVESASVNDEMDNRYAVNLHSDLVPVSIPDAPDLADEQRLYLAETELDGNTWYRLRLGFFATEADAQAAMDEWLDQYPSAWLVRVGPKERAAAGAEPPAEVERVAQAD